MTENEAIEIIKKHCEGCEHHAGIECFAQGEEGICWEVKKRAIMSLRKVQEYKTIGTVEECRAAVEKQRAKKPILSAPCKSINYYLCPNCGKILPINKPFCSECGNAVDWRDTP